MVRKERRIAYRSQERFRYETRSRVQLQKGKTSVTRSPWGITRATKGTYKELHLGDLLVDLLHELDDKVDELVLEHLLGVEVGHEERDVVAGDGLAAQDEEALGALLQEARELVHEDVLDLVGLLDLDADAHAVDAGLDEHALVLVARDGQRRQQDLGGGAGLDLGHVVALGGLGGEVGEAERRGQGAPDGLEVGPEGLGLFGGRGVLAWLCACVGVRLYMDCAGAEGEHWRGVWRWTCHDGKDWVAPMSSSSWVRLFLDRVQKRPPCSGGVGD